MFLLSDCERELYVVVSERRVGGGWRGRFGG